ncbi:MAG: iron export ABC transporter permease subunit FetB [Candidatus Zixiibacteriota bacterium]|nr:MAG: iron export ABC transporter permease subunit FetB [candidate division Zixibacteria bacterium]
MTGVGIENVLISLILAAVALAIGFFWKIPVQKNMSIGIIRSFIQLIAVGYALKYVFDLESIWLISAVILVMILVGSHASYSMSKQVRGAFLISFAAIGTGSLITLCFMLILKIITFEARFIIPLSGMIISNAMNAAALAINRLSSDIKSNRLAVETALALGKGKRESCRRFQQQAVIAGMTSILNFMKTVGIVALPGAMTGMILAGAEPLEAVFWQLIVAYMLLSSVTISSIIAVELTLTSHFTPHHQLKLKS